MMHAEQNVTGRWADVSVLNCDAENSFDPGPPMRSDSTIAECTSICTEWVIKIPLKFSDIFPKRLGIFSPNFTCLLHVSIYARLQIFIQLSPTMTKLCHIKCDRPACVSADGGQCHWTSWAYDVNWVVALNIWHNFVKVTGSLIE